MKQKAIPDKGIEVIARKLVEKLLVFFADRTLPTIVLREADGSNAIVLNNYIRKGGDIELLGEEPLKLKSPRTGNALWQCHQRKIYKDIEREQDPYFARMYRA